ncbi:hypothetical protein HDU76_007355 [Blyttiomyces sp. JEL0837]|nr:hypothetical protein HDU76_007355 [Blyttiomyces sp. JEL0837]
MFKTAIALTAVVAAGSVVAVPTSGTTQPPNHSKVIIIGAGASGIGAAVALKKAGIDDVVILEARKDAIGGRLHNVEFPHGSNNYVELGGNWIEGLDGDKTNPISTLADKYGLISTPSDFLNVTYRDDNGLYNQDKFQARLADYNNVFGLASNLSDLRRKQDRLDISLRTGYQILGWKPNTALDKCIEWSIFDWEQAESPDVSSLEYTGDLQTFAVYGEDSKFVMDKRGYKYIFEQEAKQAGFGYDSTKLHLNKIVKEIIWADPSQSADNALDLSPEKQPAVTVKVADGSTYTADYVITSMSLGVLQNDDVKFTPSFPDWKTEALFEFHMVTYTKIFLAFTEKFWDDTEYVWYGSGFRGRVPVWQNLDHPTYKPFMGNQSVHIFFATVVSEESYRIEAQPDSVTQAELMAVLRNMYGHNIPEPTAILIPRWHSDPLFRGTYTNWPIGQTKEQFENVRAPLSRLWFTGEHTSEKFFGYVHGAWLAGLDTGNAVGKCIKYGGCPQYPYHPVLTNGKQMTKFGKGERK